MRREHDLDSNVQILRTLTHPCVIWMGNSIMYRTHSMQMMRQIFYLHANASTTVIRPHLLVPAVNVQKILAPIIVQTIVIPPMIRHRAFQSTKIWLVCVVPTKFVVRISIFIYFFFIIFWLKASDTDSEPFFKQTKMRLANCQSVTSVTMCTVWVRNLIRCRIRAMSVCALPTLTTPRQFQTTWIAEESIVASQYLKRDASAMVAFQFIMAMIVAAPLTLDAVSDGISCRFPFSL